MIKILKYLKVSWQVLFLKNQMNRVSKQSKQYVMSELLLRL